MARDPHGFRPLAMGEMEVSGGRKCYVFASETCAFDLIGAVYLHDVEAGRDGDRRPRGHHPRTLRSKAAAGAMRVRARVFRAARFASSSAGPWRNRARSWGVLLARECPADADLVVPVPDSGVPAAIGYSAESRIAVPAGADPQSLCGPHVYRALAGDSRFRREAEAESGAASAGRQARGAGGRFDCARHHQPQNCAHGAAGGRARSSPAHLVPADDFALLLWRGYADARRVDRGEPEDRRDPPLRGGRFAGIPVAGFAAESRGGRRSTNTATPATRATIRRNWSISRVGPPPARSGR